MIQEGAKDVHDPLLGLDIARLEKEMESYHDWFDERTDEAYEIAAKAREKGFDHTLEVEIPRASDLASRTEKLLIHHLEGSRLLKISEYYSQSLTVKQLRSKWQLWLQKGSVKQDMIYRRVSMLHFV
jgi:hypothetical protein